MPQKITAYRCAYCERLATKKSTMTEHEKTCSFGPHKCCTNCASFRIGHVECEKGVDISALPLCAQWAKAGRYKSRGVIAKERRAAKKKQNEDINEAFAYLKENDGATVADLVAIDIPERLAGICHRIHNEKKD